MPTGLSKWLHKDIIDVMFPSRESRRAVMTAQNRIITDQAQEIRSLQSMIQRMSDEIRDAAPERRDTVPEPPSDAGTELSQETLSGAAAELEAARERERQAVGSQWRRDMRRQYIYGREFQGFTGGLEEPSQNNEERQNNFTNIV